jgi:DNA-binding MarR family transcriptional regulator
MRRTAALAHHPARHGVAPDATAPHTRHQALVPPTAVQELRQEIRSLLRRTRAVLRTAEPSVDLELDQPALEVLAHVVTERRAYPADIAQRLGMDVDVVGRASCELQQLGLLVPIADVSNPTSMALVPTAMGRRIHGEGADAASNALHAMLTGWSLEDVETLTRLLARLNSPAAT